jgi:predicted 3-demethylubiquinone-9 3-methyltransferase (glyoxalase superfamily)
MCQKITPFLWFDRNAEEGANFYVSVFPNSEITEISRYGEAGPMPTGSVMVVSFRLDGQKFAALNGGPEFTFNEAVSFLIDCQSQPEVNYYWDKLTDGVSRARAGG